MQVTAEVHHAAKRRYPEVLLLYRNGDSYQAFGLDAMLASALLAIETTQPDRSAAAPMMQFPVSDLEKNLVTLLRSGARVAIRESATPQRKSRSTSGR